MTRPRKPSTRPPRGPATAKATNKAKAASIRGSGRSGRSGRPGAAAAASPPAAREDERLQRLLSRSGVASRRKAEDLITAGRVTVNGKKAVLGQRAGPGDDVRVDGKALRPARESITYLLYKPQGVVTTANDELGRQTVLTLVPQAQGLHPVGRLDRDSEGLLLLTTDGDLTLLLTHPRYQHEKEYRLWCKQGTVAGEALARLQHGVMLDDGPAKAVGARPAPGGAVVIMTEGRKRQVRRMLGAVGYDVERLVRTRVGALQLGSMQPGDWREVKAKELAGLGYTRG